MSRAVACCVLLLALLLAPSGRAAEPPAPAAPVRLEGAALFDAPREGAELWVGGGPLSLPSYPGAARSQWRPVPAVTGGWRDVFDFDVLDGAQLAVFKRHGFSFGPAARVRFGRHRSDDRQRLAGLRDFGATIEPGGFIAYEAGPFALESTLTRDPFRTHGGAVWETRAQLGAAVGRVGFGGGPFVRYGSQAFMRSYFGIPEGIAGRLAYAPHAGWERAGLMGQGEWRVADAWALRTYLEAGRLLGPAARSPLVSGRGGSRTQLFLGFFIVYRAI